MTTLNYAGTSYNLAAGTRDGFGRLSDELVAEGLPAMKVLDGDREPEDQLRIWYERMTLTPGNRRVYGTKRWQGKTWYQIHPDAVGIPDTSNHEKRRANDLAFPYNSNTAAHRRAQALAKKHNITCEGLGFREWWHWTFWGALGVIGAPAGGGSAVVPAIPDESEEDEMNKDKYCWYKRADGVIVNAIYNTGSGYFQPFESNDGAYNTAKAQGHDLAGPTFQVSESDFASIRKSCADVRTGKG